MTDQQHPFRSEELQQIIDERLNDDENKENK